MSHKLCHTSCVTQVVSHLLCHICCVSHKLCHICWVSHNPKHPRLLLSHPSYRTNVQQRDLAVDLKPKVWAGGSYCSGKLYGCQMGRQVQISNFQIDRAHDKQKFCHKTHFNSMIVVLETLWANVMWEFTRVRSDMCVCARVLMFQLNCCCVFVAVLLQCKQCNCDFHKLGLLSCKLY